MIFQLFKKKANPVDQEDTVLKDGMYRYESGAQLLISHNKLINHIRRLSSASSSGFDCYYLPVLERYAESMQVIPVSVDGPFAKRGGAIEKSLLLAVESLRVRQGCLLPVGSTAEEIAKTKELWTFAVFIGALLHRVGQNIYEYEMVFFDSKERRRDDRFWPGISKFDDAYPNIRIRKRTNELKKLERHAPLLMLRHWLGEDSFDWLMSNDKVMDSLLSCMIGGNLDDKNPLSDIIQKGYAHVIKKSNGVLNSEQPIVDLNETVPNVKEVEQVHEPVVVEITQTEPDKVKAINDKPVIKVVEKQTPKDLPKAQVSVKKEVIEPGKAPDVVEQIVEQKSEKPTAEQFIAKIKCDIDSGKLKNKWISVKGERVDIVYPMGLKDYTTVASELRMELKSTIYWIEERKSGAGLNQRTLVLNLTPN